MKRVPPNPQWTRSNQTFKQWEAVDWSWCLCLLTPQGAAHPAVQAFVKATPDPNRRKPWKKTVTYDPPIPVKDFVP